MIGRYKCFAPETTELANGGSGENENDVVRLVEIEALGTGLRKVHWRLEVGPQGSTEQCKGCAS